MKHQKIISNRDFVEFAQNSAAWKRDIKSVMEWNKARRGPIYRKLVKNKREFDGEITSSVVLCFTFLEFRQCLRLVAQLIANTAAFLNDLDSPKKDFEIWITQHDLGTDLKGNIIRNDLQNKFAWEVRIAPRFCPGFNRYRSVIPREQEIALN